MQERPFIKACSTNCVSTRTEKDVENDIKKNLIGLPSYPTIMPECTDFLLSQIDPKNLNDDVTQLFNEYFTRRPHKIFDGITNSDSEQTTVYDALNCDSPIFIEKEKKTNQRLSSGLRALKDLTEFGCCLPCSCITLYGNRRLKQMTDTISPTPPPPPGINRLLQPDVIWLFYFERMGVFKILGAILDDFASNGKFPIPSDNVTSLILEMMTRHFKTGLNSTVQDKAKLYARNLGWKQNTNSNIDLDKVLANSAFTRLLHRFFVLALAFYADRRLSDAIKGTVTPLPSVATVIAIQDTIDLLKSSMESFLHGRNYYNTLNGIVWVIAAVDLVRRLRDTIGIPASYNRLDQIIPAAYNILVEKKSINLSDPNRYKLHFECAQDARDVLIDIAGNAFNFSDPNELKIWLNLVESRIEGYRAAYLGLTGIDLAKPEYRNEGTLRIEQQI